MPLTKHKVAIALLLRWIVHPSVVWRIKWLLGFVASRICGFSDFFIPSEVDMALLDASICLLASAAPACGSFSGVESTVREGV
jgi:hypothetical protein